MDAALAPTANGRNRSASFFQVAGTAPATGLVSVSGIFPAPTEAQVAAGAVRGLVKAPTGTGALVDGGAAGTSGPSSSSSSSSGGGASQYPGCDTPDITLANGQVWAACNVGATTAYVGGAGQPYPSGTATRTADQKAYMGAIFQWGRNEDVTNLGTTTTLAAAGSTSSTVVGSFVISSTFLPFDWIATQNNNLWGGGSTSLGSGNYAGQTAGNQTLMRDPCASGYHVPTQAEWYAAMSALNPALTNATTLRNDTALATTLKLPLAGFRDYSSADYKYQGTNGNYWTSSPMGTQGYSVVLSATQVSIANFTQRARGCSVRCLKN